jgi:hypothetical protein
MPSKKESITDIKPGYDFGSVKGKTPHANPCFRYPITKLLYLQLLKF